MAGAVVATGGVESRTRVEVVDKRRVVVAAEGAGQRREIVAGLGRRPDSRRSTGRHREVGSSGEGRESRGSGWELEDCWNV